MGLSARPFHVTLFATLLLAAPLASAQGEAPSPERLFVYGDDRQAPVNDVAITANGGLAGAALGNPGAGADEEGSVCPWNLAEDPRSDEPAWATCAEPTSGSGLLGDADLGLEAVAVHDRGASSPHLAAGNLGDSSENEIYVYRLSGGSGSEAQVEYGDDDPPDGAVEDLVFLDSDTLLAWHDGALSLLERESGNTYAETDDGRWSPPADITDLAVSSGGPILVATSTSDATNERLQLRVLENDGGDLVESSSTETLQDRGTSAVVDVDDAAERLVVGTDDGWQFYYGLEATDDGFNFTDGRYGNEVGGDVTAVAMGADGERFAAGTDGGSLFVYQVRSSGEEGPVADVLGSVDVQGAVDEVDFAQSGQQIYATSGALQAFNVQQFEREGDVEPLWIVPAVSSTDFADSGQRFVAHNGTALGAYQHAYEAEVNLTGPTSVTPGEVATFQVDVTNTGSLFDTFELGADVPSSWSTEWNASELSILPGQTRSATLNLTPDRGQAPGDVSLEVTATSQAAPDGELAGEASATLTVEEIRSVALDVDADRQEVRQGDTASLGATLENTGNVQHTTTLSVGQDEDWAVRIDGQPGSSADVDLDTAEEVTVPLEIDVPDGAQEGSTNTVTVTATPEDGAAQEATVDLVVNPSYGATITGPTEAVDAQPDTQASFQATVENTGNVDETYTIRTYSNASNPELLWRTNVDPSTVDATAGGSENLDVTVNVPRGAEAGGSTDVTLVVRSTTLGEKVDETTVTVQVPEDDGNGIPLPAALVPAAIGLAALARRDP